VTTIAVDPTSDLRLGGECSFVTTDVPRTKNPPRIEVLAYSAETGKLVYGEVRDVTDQPFLLGGSSSLWLQHPEPVHCRATLFWWTFHPNQVYNWLAACTFDAT
jgi:hypothetical protein